MPGSSVDSGDTGMKQTGSTLVKKWKICSQWLLLPFVSMTENR